MESDDALSDDGFNLAMSDVPVVAQPVVAPSADDVPVGDTPAGRLAPMHLFDLVDVDVARARLAHHARACACVVGVCVACVLCDVCGCCLFAAPL